MKQKTAVVKNCKGFYHRCTGIGVIKRSMSVINRDIDLVCNSAERTGFEPAKPFRGLHAFQACLFNHSSTFPNMSRRNTYLSTPSNSSTSRRNSLSTPMRCPTWLHA